MSSNINTTNIDANFPIAGQDNSSQGFRDNFSAIKLAFSTATIEISDLQTYTAKKNETNDFQFNSLVRANLQNSGFLANNTVTPTGELDFSQGSYKKVVTTNATPTTTFYVSHWPTSGISGVDIYGQLRLEVAAPTNSTHDINFTAPTGTLLHDSSNVRLPYTASTATTSIWDLWSTDGGLTVFVTLVSGSYA